jgi:hypothetical protein
MGMIGTGRQQNPRRVIWLGRTIRIVVGAGLLAVALAACAAGPNTALSAGTTSQAGFWLGLWQGAICPITFVISLFTDQVSIYEVHNNGGWYDFGFVLGLSVAFGGSARSAAPTRRRKRSPDTATPSGDVAA